MNQGVEILLARMDSHPQEFCSGTMDGRYGRWTAAIDKVIAIGGSFTGEERLALSAKLRDLERTKFTQDVMKQLLKDPDEEAMFLRQKVFIPAPDEASAIEMAKQRIRREWWHKWTY